MVEPTLESCYLCGEEIAEDRTADHVPPKQVYSREIRHQHNPNLLTLPTHGACNHSFQMDEEYFVHAVAPLAIGSYSGSSMVREIAGQYDEGRNVPLSKCVFSEFERRPSGLVLPSGKIVKRYDGDRVWRVAWKIVRGLYFFEYRLFLPEDTPNVIELVSPEEKLPPVFSILRDEPIRGLYPRVFHYKYCRPQAINDFHLWVLRLWEELSLCVAFHDPACECDLCMNT